MGKGLLITFYLFVFTTTLVEQWDYLNEFFIALPLCILGVYATIHFSFKQAIVFALVCFPIAFEHLYFQVLVPHMPLFLIKLNKNTWVFSGLYVLFLVIIYRRNWVFIGVLTFLFGCCMKEKQMPIQLMNAYKYSYQGKASPSILTKELLKINQDETQAIYLICLDGYPNVEGTEYANISKIDSILKPEKFHVLNHLSMSPQTSVSIRQLITEKYEKQEFTNLNSKNYGKELTISLEKLSPKNYKIHLGSILTDYNLAQPFFSVFESIRPNKMILKPLKQFFDEGNRIGSKRYFENYHEELISQIDGKRQQTKFLHFITFHGIFTEKRQLKNKIVYADNLLIRVIKQIRERAPQAKVIIFSDHGERGTPDIDARKAVFYANF